MIRAESQPVGAGLPIPSRVDLERDARAALLAERTVVVRSSAGGGRSTFARRLVAGASGLGSGSGAIELAGSAALSGMPLAHLAALAARVPELAGYAADPVGVLAALGERTADAPLRVLVDGAEHTDEASAAVLAQLAVLGVLRLLLTVRADASLPAGFAELLSRPDTAIVELRAIEEGDARVLLDGHFELPVNASASARLLARSGGTPGGLLGAAEAALHRGDLVVARGYLVLAPEAADAAHAAPGTERSDRSGRIARAAAEHAAGRPDSALAELAPLLAVGDEEARICAGRIEILSGNPGRAAAHFAPAPHDSAAFLAESALWLARGGAQGAGEAHARWADDPEVPPGVKLGLLAAAIVEQCYAGDPARALERAFAAMAGPVWDASTGAERGELLYAVHLAVLSEGTHEHIHGEHFAGLDWDDLDLDHGLFIIARACVLLEYGRAAEALELAGQVLALTEIGDPHGIAGFAAAVGAGAAATLENATAAAEFLALYRAGTPCSGQLLRPEAERLALGAILLVEGESVAAAECAALSAAALAAGNHYLVMRLTHEAWRLRLCDSDGEAGGDGDGGGDGDCGSAEALAAAAAPVTGQLAEALRQLADPESVWDAASALHANGRTLFAAEFLAQAARDARAAGDRVRANTLLTQSGELADELPGVNTPRLARVRLDPELLTPREIEVCVRAAAGLTNTEIGDELFLSSRTVEGHLQRAYAKLGVSDRRQFLPLAGS